VSPPFLVSLFILFDCLLISEVAISVESWILQHWSWNIFTPAYYPPG
jgi:hypothetical protein